MHKGLHFEQKGMAGIMIDYDLHVHTGFSSDSEEIPENMAEKAIELGMKGLCFTDHMDLYYPEKCVNESGGDFTFDLESYFIKMNEVREKYVTRADILTGIELGLRNEPELKDKTTEEYLKMTADNSFDFVIGSTHCLENIDPYYKEYWDGRTAEEGIKRYYDAIAENITRCTCFDTLGHLDYLVRYVEKEAALRSLSLREKEGFSLSKEMIDEKNFYGKYIYRTSDFSDITDKILKTLINTGKALEINGAGLKYGLGFAHPKREILIRYRELGGELITIGSDAHAAGQLAGYFSQIREELIDLGFKYYFIYKKRRPIGLAL